MASPDKTRIGPPATIIEPSGVVWSIRSDGNVLRATSATTAPLAVNGRASEMAWAGGAVYSHSPTVPNHWWKVVSVKPNGATVTWADAGVTDPAPSVIPPPPAQSAVTFSAASLNAGAPISVTLAGGGGNAKDWLTIAKVTDAPEVFGATQGVGWQYAPTASFSWQTTLPAIGGQYEVRYFLNNAYVLAAKSAPFTVVVPYAVPVFSFPNLLSLSIGVPTPLASFVSSALPLVWTAQDNAQINLDAVGKITAKVAGAGTVTVEVDDGH